MWDIHCILPTECNWCQERGHLTHWGRDKMATISADDIFKCIWMNEKFSISIWISLKFVPKGLTDNKTALVQIMAWCRSGNKPLSEPMVTYFIDAFMRPSAPTSWRGTSILMHKNRHSFMVMLLLGSLNRENTVHRQLRFISCKAAIILGAAQWSDLIDSFSSTSNKIRVPYSNMQDESTVNVGRNINCNTQNIRINHMCMLNIFIYIHTALMNVIPVWFHTKILMLDTPNKISRA